MYTHNIERADSLAALLGLDSMSDAGASVVLSGLAAVPPAVRTEVADESSFVRKLVANTTPPEVLDWITERVVRTEKALSDAFRGWEEARDKARMLAPAGGIPQDVQAKLDAVNRERLALYVKHNDFKFYCAFVPQLRERLRGKVKPPSYSAVRASSSSMANWIRDHTIDPTAQQLVREGALLEGLGVPPVVAGIAAAAAVAVAAMLMYYATVEERAKKARVEAYNATAQMMISQGKVTEATAFMARAAGQEDVRDRSGLTANIGRIFGWVVAIAGIALLGPPALKLASGALEARRSTAALPAAAAAA